MIEGKGLGGKRICRVNVSLDNQMNQKLNKLAIACNMKPTTLARMLIEKCLDNPQLVSDLQNEFAVHSAYRVIPVTRQGKIEYVLSDGK
ncbi:hypothetical protein [Caldibacillus thermoamylovorans]|uniref:hypothetical protein n=1 Tax=Caldibacillus thermoamylovorans TaxID=35841 RepID=UPI00203D2C5A|nr:hypothetical protein [Caldibacillus thermoamylovorans]MCM3053658.1 hypothetical protein [Caldibacillus thermoamylovorans]